MRTLLLLLMLGLSSCCNYFPLIDRPAILDFKKVPYSFSKDLENIVENDSFEISTKADSFIPINCRSKRLKYLLSSISFEIKKNVSIDSIIVAFDNYPIVTVSDGTNTISGGPTEFNRDTPLVLVIKNQDYYFVQNSLKTNSLLFKFDFSQLNQFDYQKQEIKIKFGNVRLNGRKTTQTKEIIGFYKNPIE